MYLSEKTIDILRKYSETLDKSLIDGISNEIVSSIVHTIFAEAVRTYNEDLYEDKHYKDCEDIDIYFVTDLSLYEQDKIFWYNEYNDDPWKVHIKINNNPQNIDFKEHNYVNKYCSINSDNYKLDNIWCNMIIECSHKDWRFKYVTVIFKNVYDAFKKYEKMLKNGWDEQGFVFDKKLATRIVRIWLEQKCYSFVEGERFEKFGIFLSDCNGGWNIDEDRERIDGIGGYNGLIIRNIKANIKDEDNNLREYIERGIEDEFYEDMCKDGLVVLPVNGQLETFCFFEGD